MQDYLVKKNMTYTHPSCIDILRPLKFIAFPHGLLTFGESKRDDVLQVTGEQGLPYAVAMLTYYFANDIEAFYDGDYVRDYSALTVLNTRVTGLSVAILDLFLDAGLATLHRVPEEHKDGAIVGCPDYTYLFFKEFDDFNEIDRDIAHCQGFKEPRF